MRYQLFQIRNNKLYWMLIRISEKLWDSESEGNGASSDCIVYLGKGILYIFRQPLKYLCFI